MIQPDLNSRPTSDSLFNDLQIAWDCAIKILSINASKAQLPKSEVFFSELEHSSNPLVSVVFIFLISLVHIVLMLVPKNLCVTVLLFPGHLESGIARKYFLPLQAAVL